MSLLPVELENQKRNYSDENHFSITLIYPPEHQWTVLGLTVLLTKRSLVTPDGFRFDHSKDEFGKLELFFSRSPEQLEFK